jgi:hypothetical protein
MSTSPSSRAQTRLVIALVCTIAAGCNKFNPAAAKGRLNDGSCIQILAATGMRDNDITLQLTTPFGENVKGPAPGTEAILSYCVTQAGPYTGTLSAALNGPFTAAAITCPRAAVKPLK